MTTLNFETGILDDVGWRILHELQADARISFSELGRRVGLSSPAVAERVRRLEEAGIIKGYHAKIHLPGIGLNMMVIIRLTTPDGYASDRLADAIIDMPEVLECYKVTGEDCYIMKAVVTSIGHLEKLIDSLKRYGSRITTSVVLSPVIENRQIKTAYLPLIE